MHRYHAIAHATVWDIVRNHLQPLLNQTERLMHERVMYAPIFEPATLHGIGPRVEEAAVGLNPLLYFAAPYEDMRLRKP